MITILFHISHVLYIANNMLSTSKTQISQKAQELACQAK